jgi:hypothetical protein
MSCYDIFGMKPFVNFMTVGKPETSGLNHLTSRNNPENESIRNNRGGSLRPEE